MPGESDLAGFALAHAAGRPFSVWARVQGDLLTPVAAFMKLRARAKGPAFLLESVEGGAVRGRYSIIGLDPDLLWRCCDGRAEVNRSPDATPDLFAVSPAPPLRSLRDLIAESSVDLDPGLPPMAAGLFGYLGYDMVRQMERLEAEKPDPIGVPQALLTRPRSVLVFDDLLDEVFLVRVVRPREGQGWKAAQSEAASALEEIAATLDEAVPAQPRLRNAPAADPVSNMKPGEYEDLAARAREYIAAGDIFQVVLSQRFEAPFPLPGLALYRSLRRVNPAPFLCFLDFVEFQIVCSSPEILVRVRDGQVTVRPIAGTRPRGADPAEDARLADELLADPKERAEHLMLLDLGRNDAGRVASLGSVSVTDSVFIERYSQVMHIVSNVEARLRPEADALDALVAGFPAGTVSGAPKVRAMQIIDELEADGRGPYAGCIGYFGADGQMDTCIVLRTAVVKDGRMYVQAGAGIVHDSDPASEDRECASKARALFRAAADAIRLAAEPRRGQ